jgi:hypothetical protein
MHNEKHRKRSSLIMQNSRPDTFLLFHAEKPPMILRILAILFILACGLLFTPAQAATYTMAAGSRPPCSSGWSVSGSTYTCPPGATVTLSSGDAIVPASAITIVVNAGITLNGSNTIGSASVSVNLTTTYGNLTTTGTSTVYGNLTTSSGAVSLTGTTVNGTLTTNGTLTISGGGITGNVSAKNGITSTNGAEFGGNVTATNGTLTLTDGSVAGAVHSGCCVVTTNNTNVGNGVSSGAINGSGGSTVIINGGTVSGNILTNGGSGISINNGANITGNVTSNCCTVAINNSTVTGNITSNGGSGVQIQNGSTITGDVNAPSYQAPATVVDSTSIVHGTCDSQTNSSSDPGSYSNRCDGGVTGSTTTVKFNACHNYSSGNCEGGSGRLYTRLAGTAFSVDVVALKSDGTVDTSFDKKVTVTLIARSATGSADANNCFVPDYSLTLDNAATAFTSGRLTIPDINVASAYPDVRIMVSCDSANCATPIAAVCSADNFAIRPVNFTVTSSNANADSNGSSTTATPAIKAGAQFTLTAATVAGYNGMPKVSPDLLEAHDGAVAGTLTGSFPQATNGTATGNAFTYSEVGYFRFSAQGVYEDTFTAVDQPESDCTDDYSNTLVGGKYGCKFGNIAATAYFGRFIPDHFGITGSVVTRSDLQTLENQTTPFTYMDEPMKLSLVVTAYNKGEEATQYYTGAFAKLNATTNLSNWTCTSGTQCMGLSAISGTTLLTGRLAIDTTSTNSTAPSNTVWGDGQSDFTLYAAVGRNTDPDGPYDVLKFGAKPLDSDGVTLPPKAATDTDHCVNLNAATGVEDANCAFGSALETNLRRKIFETRVRYGRLKLSNAYGSELLDLPIPVEAQYWNGSYYTVNKDDSSTTFPASSIIMDNYLQSLNACETHFSPAGSLTMSGGILSPGLNLTVSGLGNTGSVDLELNIGSTVSGNTCTTATEASATAANMSWFGTVNPTARATFGIYKGNSKFIYIRELY